MLDRPAAGSTRTGAPMALAAAAALLVLGALVFVISEGIVAAHWPAPGYSYRGNYISDLGNPQCGPYDGRVVCSPLHTLMNWAFVGQGVLLGGAVGLVGRVLDARPRVVLLSVGGLTVLGFVLTGALHSSPQAVASNTLWLHYLGATLAILGGNTIAILVSRQWRRLRVPAAAGRVGIGLGVGGIVTALVWQGTFGMVPPGILERAAVYAFLLWQVGIAGLLLTTPVRPQDQALTRKS